MKGLRQTFRAQAVTWATEQLKFLDESGLYLGMTPSYGWAPAGQRVVDRVPTNYGTAWTTVACIGLGGVQAPWLLEGAMDGSAFTTYVTEVLAPTLQPGDILVLDNLAAHKQAAVRAAVEEGRLDAARLDSFRKLLAEVRALEIREDPLKRREERARWKAIYKSLRHPKKE